LKEGEIYILMTKGTRDEYFYWSAFNKEKKMKAIIASLQNRLRKERPGLSKHTTQDPQPITNLQGQTKIGHFV